MDDQRDQPDGAELAERVVAHRAGRLGREALAPEVAPERVADLDLARPVGGLGPRGRLPGVGVPDQQPDAADHRLVVLAHRREEPEAVRLPALDHAPDRALGLARASACGRRRRSASPRGRRTSARAHRHPRGRARAAAAGRSRAGAPAEPTSCASAASGTAATARGAARLPSPASCSSAASSCCSTYRLILSSNRCAEIVPAIRFGLFQRRELVRRLVQRQLVDVLVLDVFQSLLAEVAHADAARQRRCRAAPASSPRRGSGRRARPSRCERRGRRRGRGSPPRRRVGSPVCRPIRTRTSAPRGHSCSESARCPSTAARTASFARGNEKKNASPCVSTSWPAAASKALAQDPPLVGQHLPVVVAELLQQARRALDVGEQERDGAARESHPVTVQR